MEKITIGIPFYNAEKYLDKCIQSVIAQTVGNWELILVDDGSTDASLEVCSKYVAMDLRIQVIKGNHQGVAQARNLILAHATGNFLCFMDADDWYEANYLECLQGSPDSDLVVCGYFVDCYKQTGEHVSSNAFTQPELYVSCIAERPLLDSVFASGVMCSVCNKLFKLAVIRKYGICFKHYSVNEDFIFVLDYLSHARTVSILPKALYHWVRIEGNLSGVMSIPDDILAIYEESHRLLAAYLNDKDMAAKICYYSYELVIYKFLDLYNKGVVSAPVCFSQLAKFHASSWVKHSFSVYQPQAPFEKILYYFNRRGWFRLTNWARNLYHIIVKS